MANKPINPLRALRPLLWWLILVLALYGIRLNQRLLEQTRLYYSISLNGQPLPYAVTVTLDGKPFNSGNRISLGHHRFQIAGSKTDPFVTNLSIWYGGFNFGTIDLKRSMSVLAVTADPTAPLLTIHGPEFDVELTNSSGMTSSVPTDQYAVMSRYAHWTHSDDVLVSAGTPTSWRIAPRLGAAQITCNESDATGQFLQADGQVIEYVKFPYSISELPEGTYQGIEPANHRFGRTPQGQGGVVVAQTGAAGVF